MKIRATKTFAYGGTVYETGGEYTVSFDDGTIMIADDEAELAGELTSTPFNEVMTASRTPQFTLSSLNPLSPLRNELTGTPTHEGAEYEILADEAIETAEIGRYVPGFAAEAGIGVRVATLPTGSQIMRWGYFDDEDGFGWVLSATGLSTFVRSASVDTLYAQAAWSVDPLDGSGVSGLSLDLASGKIFQIRFTWYGYGQVNFNVVDTQEDSPEAQLVLTAHRWSPGGATSTANANLPIRAEVVGAGDGVLRVAGRQFSIIGRYVPQLRFSSISREVTGITTAFTPILAMRRRDDADARRIKVRVQGLQLSTSAPIEYALVQAGTVTFGTAVPGILMTAAQSAVEFSVDPSAFSVGTGQAIVTGLVTTSGQGGNAIGADAVTGPDLPLPGLRSIVLVARALSGTANVTALLRSSEEW
jgi:hypothetical protein